MMTQSGPRAETLASRCTYRVAIHRERLPGELLSGSERPRPGWFLDMKYQTCFILATTCISYSTTASSLRGNIVQGCSREATIARGKAECYICLEATPTCNIFLWCMCVSGTLTGLL